MLSKSLSGWMERTAAALQPTNADLLMVGNYFKERILDRTSRGLDSSGQAFAPYSEKRPYYWNPYTGLAHHWGKRSNSVKRMAKKLGADKSRSGLSVKFQSYAAFKRALGRAGVDLTGPRAPHMLQAMQVRKTDRGVVLGIYGEAAARAQGHHYGNPARGLPKRRFLGGTDEDRAGALKLVSAQMRARFKAKITGGGNRFPTLPLPV